MILRIVLNDNENRYRLAFRTGMILAILIDLVNYFLKPVLAPVVHATVARIPYELSYELSLKSVMRVTEGRLSS